MQNERKSSGINIGSASIIMVFSVLCLTVFAVLTLVTANSEYKLANKSADSVRNYYAADTLATEKLAQLKILSNDGKSTVADIMTSASKAGMTVNNTAEGIEFVYTEKVDSEQDLSVKLLYLGSNFKVIEWKMVNNAEWNPDGNIKLWDGEN